MTTDENSNAPSPRQCRSCSKLLGDDEPTDICAACLLKIGFESDVGSEQTSETNPTSVDDFQEPEESIEQIQTLFAELEILEVIGRGGMGVVYKARQKHLDRFVALKLLRSKFSSDPTFAERFTREARALAKLAHPNIIGVHDFGQVADRPYLLMEYVDGVTLREMIESKTLTPEKALAMVPAICDALQFAHEAGIVHRDIKPENILIDRRGRVRIADFGLARLILRSPQDWTLTGTRQVVGTPHYMAPEQLKSSPTIDHRADIYSLGVVLYEMLTGNLPLGRFELPSHRLKVDVRLDDVVLRTLQQEPERRYQHASEIQTEIESLVGSSVRKAHIQPVYHVAGRGIAIAWTVAAVIDAFFALVFLHRCLFDNPRTEDVWALLFHGSAAFLLSYGAWNYLTRNSLRWVVAAVVTGLVPVHYGFLVASLASLFAIYRLVKGNERYSFAADSSRPTMSDLSHKTSEVASVVQSVANQVAKKSWLFSSVELDRLKRINFRWIYQSTLGCIAWLCGLVLATAVLFFGYSIDTFPTQTRLTEHVDATFKDNARFGLNLSATRNSNTRGFRTPELVSTEDNHFGILVYDREIQAGEVFSYSSQALTNHYGQALICSPQIELYRKLGGDWQFRTSKPNVMDIHMRPDLRLQYSVAARSRSLANTSVLDVAYYENVYSPISSADELADIFANAGLEPGLSTRAAIALMDAAEDWSQDANSGLHFQNATTSFSKSLSKDLFRTTENYRRSVVAPQFWAVAVYGVVLISLAILGFIIIVWYARHRAKSSARRSEVALPSVATVET